MKERRKTLYRTSLNSGTIYIYIYILEEKKLLRQENARIQRKLLIRSFTNSQLEELLKKSVRNVGFEVANTLLSTRGKGGVLSALTRVITLDSREKESATTCGSSSAYSAGVNPGGVHTRSQQYIHNNKVPKVIYNIYIYI